MRALSHKWRLAGERVAFVPTMGALHEGHLAVVRRAKEMAARVVVSIFVNPLQFGPSEDFSRYPRTLAADLEALSPVGVDAVFAPNASEIYPHHFQTTVSNKEMSQGLCGRFRPGHFDGVLTVVLKLLHLVEPDIALFGKKDYQQWRLIERMVQDLGLGLEVMGCETIRESDGLAMSSRNRYLSAEQRQKSTLIIQGLRAAKSAWLKGERSRERILSVFTDKIAECSDMTVQYAELVRSKDLGSVDHPKDGDDLVMITAVIYGDVRLIDNLEFSGEG